MEDEEEIYGSENEEASLGALSRQLDELMNPTTTVEAQGYARKILDKELAGNRGKLQEGLLAKMEEEANTARSALRAAREKVLARRYNPGEAWLALSAALSKPTQFGTLGEAAGNVSAGLIEPNRKRNEFRTAQDASLLDLDKQMYDLDDKLLMRRLALLQAQGVNETRLAQEALKMLGRRTQGTGLQNKAQAAVDREYAKDYVEFIQTGAPDAAKALEELGSARDRLRGYSVDEKGERIPGEKDDNLTGPIVGTLSTLPRIGKVIQDLAFPESSDVQETVEYTVQRSLRPILGSQFTKDEGERLISRVYNNRLSEGINAERLDRLIKQLRRAYEEKIRAAKYFEQNQTLLGFKGKTSWSFSDFGPDGSWPGDEGSEGPSEDPTDDMPAVDPNAPPPEGVIKFEDLPKGEKSFLRRMKDTGLFAEGGIAKKNTIKVQMPDGRIIEVAPGTTQEEILAQGDDGSEFDIELDPLRAALGAGAGFTAGQMASRLPAGIADLIPGHRTSSAEERVLRLLEESNLSPAEWAARTRRARRSGVPARALDMGPDGMRDLAETALTQSQTEGPTLTKELSERQAGSRERTVDQLNKNLKPDEFFSQEEKLRESLYKNAEQPYQQAFDAHPAVRSEALMDIMDTPAGKEAVKRAIKSMKNKPGMKMGKADISGMVSKPSLQFLDSVKRQLDDMIRKEEGTGANYQATEHGRDLRKLRSALVDELDLATTDESGTSLYKSARDIYSGDLEVIDALRSGREDFGRLQPEQIRKAVNKMSFAEKDAFRSGVYQNLLETLEGPSQDIAAAKRLVGSPEMIKKLELLFDTPVQFKLFKDALDLEAEMFDKSKRTINVGETARRRKTGPERNLIERGAERAPTLGVFSPTYWALKILREKPRIKPREADEVLKMLRAGEIPELAELEKRLTPKVGRAARRVKRHGKAGKIGALLGALAGALSLEEDEDPSLEGLTEEEVEWANRPAMSKGGKFSTLGELIAHWTTRAQNMFDREAAGEQLPEEEIQMLHQIGTYLEGKGVNLMEMLNRDPTGYTKHAKGGKISDLMERAGFAKKRAGNEESRRLREQFRNTFQSKGGNLKALIAALEGIQKSEPPEAAAQRARDEAGESFLKKAKGGSIRALLQELRKRHDASPIPEAGLRQEINELADRFGIPTPQAWKMFDDVDPRVTPVRSATPIPDPDVVAAQRRRHTQILESLRSSADPAVREQLTAPSLMTTNALDRAAQQPDAANVSQVEELLRQLQDLASKVTRARGGSVHA